jgi:hypothetical protein
VVGIELTISAATSNTDFREIVTRAWATLAKLDFRENIDQGGAVTGTVAEGWRRFWSQAERFTEAMLCDAGKHLARLAVWF